MDEILELLEPVLDMPVTVPIAGILVFIFFILIAFRRENKGVKKEISGNKKEIGNVKKDVKQVKKEMRALVRQEPRNQTYVDARRFYKVVIVGRKEELQEAGMVSLDIDEEGTSYMLPAANKKGQDDIQYSVADWTGGDA